MKNKRLAIYSLYSPDGVVRDYVLYMLRGLHDAGADVLVVVNGDLIEESKKRLGLAGVEILVRNGVANDFDAWRDGIEHYGYKKLGRYDSVLFTDSDLYGPIYPFAQMWDEMDSRPCDFWTINNAQTYWIVFKQSAIKSDTFSQWWNNPHNTKSITDFFAAHGARYDTYMDCEKYTQLVGDINPECVSDIQVMQDKNPVIKREYFFHPEYKTNMMRTISDYRPRMLMEWLRNNNMYDTDMIWADLLATQNMSDIMDILQVTRILPDKVVTNPTAPLPKAAFVAHIYYATMIDYMVGYLQNLPEYVDIYIVNTNDDVADACRAAFAKFPNKVFYRLQENRGREQAALLVTCRDVFDKYEIVGIAHSKATPQVHKRLIGEEFRNRCIMCLLQSREYVENLLNMMAGDSRLGIVAPLIMMHGQFRCIDDQYSLNKENMQNTLKNLFGITDINLPKYLICAMGGMFWAKTAAFKTITKHNWQYSDFPAEPLTAADGLFPHALERLFGVLAQYDGFYSVYAAPNWFAESYMSDLHLFKRNICNSVTTNIGIYLDHEIAMNFDGYLNHYAKHRPSAIKATLKYWLYSAIAHITSGKTFEKYDAKAQRYKHHLDVQRRTI